MSSMNALQEALVKSAEQIEKLAKTVEKQGTENAKLQARIYCLTAVIAISAAVQTGVAIVVLLK
jgi:uncharacterized protein YukE